MARMRVGLLESIEKLLSRLESLESDNEVEMLKMELGIIGFYYFKYPHFDLSPHLDKIMNTHIRFVEDQILHSLGKKTSDSKLIFHAKYVNQCIGDETLSRRPKLSYQISFPGTNMSDGYLLEFMDSHIEILNYISCAGFITQLTVEQVVVLKNKLRLLRDFHFCKTRGRIVHEKLEYLSTQVQTMAFEIAHLCFTFWAEFNIDCIDIKKFFRLICEIELIEPELQEIFLNATRASLWSHSEISAKIKQPDIFAKFLWGNLSELQNSMASSDVPMNAQILKEIDILKSYLTEFVPSKDVLACIASIVNEARFFVHKIKDNTINEAKEGDMQLATSDILVKIESSRKQIEEIHLGDTDKPVTDRLFPIQNLLHSLNSLMNSMDNSLASVEHQIGIIQKELGFLNSFFKRNEHESLANLQARAVGLAYDAEYVIHFLRLNDDCLCHHLSLNDVIREIKLIKTEVTKLRGRMPDIPTPGSPENLVLTRGPGELDVISITGMAGLGKTTLANKVYCLDTVASHFHVRAWCCVSQEYDLKDLMHNIYSQVIGCKNQMREDDIAEKLRRFLLGKRYLIVLDDIWTTKAWEELSRALPKVSSLFHSRRELAAAADEAI
nr:putative late blight resistance protein homolog R1B-16 isoform X2 [Ipomoea batatas]